MLNLKSQVNAIVITVMILITVLTIFIIKTINTPPAILVIKPPPVDSAIVRGMTTFKKNCNVCHSTKTQLHYKFAGIVDRLGENYLRLYITRQDSLTNIKDPYAMQLKEEYKMANSHNFKYSKKELDDLIAYLR
ncbi:hypothetical protein DC498_10080 [Terrimonas sp.]|uniref:c-type cytochrome n=1 Tax=Terrimonas sp. TaxID=1914338 RepID=UPI000D518CEF|nr:cytochrome c [Terrimonas sp.]PVD52444.1 hypothetical protein DC498_10080 [Terrimonas sp.]